MLTNIILFNFIVAFILWGFGYKPLVADIASCFTPGLIGNSTGICSQSTVSILGVNIPTFAGTAAAFLTGTSAIVISVFFPNYVAMFIPFAIALSGLLMFPLDLMNEVGVSSQIKLFIGGLLGISYLLAIIYWLKGNEG